jgi:hypothetical protein
MGGEGFGNWYRFDKKTTTSECHSVDVRHLHQEALLRPRHWFSLRWSRAGPNTGSIRAAVIGDEKPEEVILTYRHRSGPSGEWEEVREPVPLNWTACNFGGNPVWSWALLPVPSLLRSRLREPARGQGAPSSEKGAEDKEAAGRECEYDGTLPEEASQDAPKDLHEDVLGAP